MIQQGLLELVKTLVQGLLLEVYAYGMITDFRLGVEFWNVCDISVDLFFILADGVVHYFRLFIFKFDVHCILKWLGSSGSFPAWLLQL
jgi:hypothetical protein